MRPAMALFVLSFARYILAAALVAVRASAGGSEYPLKIGLLAPPDKSDAISVRQAAQIAAVQTGVLIIVRGKPGQWGTDGNEAAVLALDDEVAGIITSGDGSVAHQALQVAGRTRIPVVTLCPDSSV